MRLFILWFFTLCLMWQMNYAETYGFMQFKNNPVEILAAKRPVYLGEFVITYYDNCIACCGKTDGITASGVKAQTNRTIAADSSIPFGTELIINGNTYVVEDRGGKIGKNRIDVYVESHSIALQNGFKTEGVWL